MPAVSDKHKAELIELYQSADYTKMRELLKHYNKQQLMDGLFPNGDYRDLAKPFLEFVLSTPDAAWDNIKHRLDYKREHELPFNLCRLLEYNTLLSKKLIEKGLF